MRIAIAGCGISGTAIGHLLAEQGHEVTIFEQAPECHPIGAGIMLQPSGQAVLERLGIRSEIADVSSPLWGLDARLRSGKQLVRLEYAALAAEVAAWGVHRGKLFDRLLHLCRQSGVTVETSARVIDYRLTDGNVEVVIEQGRMAGGFDFLIATDGGRSQLRKPAKIPCATVNYSYAALWATGPCAAVNDHLYQVIDGTERLIGLLPIGSNQCSFFWGIRAGDRDAITQGDIGAWKSEVADFCPQAEELLDSLRSFRDLTFATYCHARMRRWHADRIVFIGDAAHPSSPHLGQGVNLALEDAVCFADALAETNDFDAAARSFTAQRWAKLRYYQQLTRLLTPFFQSGSRVLAFARNLALPWFPRVPFVYREMMRTLCGQKNGWIG